ncbi:Gfo/Idh/MocA family oxidoreductase [Natronolimnobius sp. AArcel1]|uniref:Gfo/Idh/MocA family protein n=1 Tax=Natronolimnobius sp. AArcel1 TaxID=1679093 RepID=UPI0013EC7BAC|nr:Gfo/Idh/MocA family oxidoreductase [Natronolimnobius sp. AArcel1]NGM67940.1 Gfo/Idh/MocA family oxidoreductase [Natronolimnobius sp. AArcel1]
MSQYTVAVIGTGPDPANPTLEGFAMGYRHAEGYRSHDQCEVVACADIVPENGAAFAETFEIDAEYVYEDYNRLLEEVEPDIVSVAVPPAIHEPIATDCAKHDAVQAIHCEKPMADSWASAQRLVQTCWRSNTQLTFNRQRRFAKPFIEANRLLEDGAIGDLERIEIGWGDFYDTGAHTVDLATMFAGDQPAEWIIAQLDYREEDVRFGAHQENQMWAQWAYDNGVHAVLSTGARTEVVGAAFVLRGSEGTIRIDADDGPMLELEQAGDRTPVDVDGEGIHRTNAEPDGRYGSLLHDRAISDLVDALETDTEPALSGRIGLTTAEILFGGYESVRKRGRVEFPLEIEDNPFEAMIDDGTLTPEPAEE